MQGLLEEAYEQVEEDYINNVNAQMRNYQRWYVVCGMKLVVLILYVCMCVCVCVCVCVFV